MTIEERTKVVMKASVAYVEELLLKEKRLLQELVEDDI